MNLNKKVVIFGPFVGEFGWELLFWQGWVRKVSRSEFRDYWKVAVSYPGREVFYPDVDQFISLPEEILDLNLSARNYICDGWKDGFPGKPMSYRWNFLAITKQLLKGIRPHKIAIQEPWLGPSIQDSIIAFTDSIKAQFGNHAETEIFSPWSYNEHQGLKFGWREPISLRDYANPENTLRIDFNNQVLERITVKPETIGIKAGYASNIVAIFPRKRSFRREDKNWSKDNYLSLILKLQDLGYTVAILGDLSGAYFVGESIPGVIDLINIPNEGRLAAQVKLLNNSLMAVGAMSGATLLALASGTPTVIFGYPEEQIRYHYENFTKTPLIYIAQMNPNVEDICRMLSDLEKFLKFEPLGN